MYISRLCICINIYAKLLFDSNIIICSLYNCVLNVFININRITVLNMNLNWFFVEYINIDVSNEIGTNQMINNISSCHILNQIRNMCYWDLTFFRRFVKIISIFFVVLWKYYVLWQLSFLLWFESVLFILYFILQYTINCYTSVIIYRIVLIILKYHQLFASWLAICFRITWQYI